MGRRGPKKMPTKLKILKGNPGHRPLPTDEPEPDVSESVPDPPDHLSDGAREEWGRLAPLLHGCGILTRIDETGLAAYCECYAEWKIAKQKVEEHGRLVKAPSGYPNVSPWYVIKKAMQKEMRSWLQEFGMTPSSRNGVAKASRKDKKPSGFANRSYCPHRRHPHSAKPRSRCCSNWPNAVTLSRRGKPSSIGATLCCGRLKCGSMTRLPR